MDQAPADFEQCLDSILTDSIKSVTLDTFFVKPDIMAPSVSPGSYACLVPSLIILNHSWLLV